MSSVRQLLQILQLSDGTFPTGGFSQSWGLETYVAEGAVCDADSFRTFLESYLTSSIGRCEGPIIARAYGLIAGCQEGADAGEELRGLEELSVAVKVTKESREASLRMGRAFARIAEPMLGEEAFSPIRKVFGGSGISYPVLYGCVCRLLEIDLHQALTAYVFASANTLVQSAVKLIPLGNVEAQKVLFEENGFMERVTSLCESTPLEGISNFCPGIDIASLRHEELPVRLYMS